jgi:hypothetical protein
VSDADHVELQNIAMNDHVVHATEIEEGDGEGVVLTRVLPDGDINLCIALLQGREISVAISRPECLKLVGQLTALLGASAST